MLLKWEGQIHMLLNEEGRSTCYLMGRSDPHAAVEISTTRSDRDFYREVRSTSCLIRRADPHAA